MSTKKKDGENKKRMARYYRQKEEEILSKMQESVATIKDNRKSASYLYILKKAMKSLSTERDKQSLIKLAALKDILKRSVEVPGKSQPLYQRLKTRDRKVEAFYETEAINLSGQRTAGPNSMKERKVLTKRIEDLYEDFKKKNPSYKISLTTFARRRPSHILLSSSRAFLQCLCEKCENPMLKMKVLNTFLQVKIKPVDHLVEQTLCDYQAFKKTCTDRKCGTCGVDKIILSWKLELESKLNQQVKWTRWEQTAKSGKDLVEKCSTSSLDNLLTELQGELQDLAKHLKMARWQRQQYQHLLNNLPQSSAIVTLDFAENYTCKFQNEVQSSHWSYKQVSIHTCVLQYNCEDDGCSKVITEYVVYVSDNLNHDAAFAKTVMERLLVHLKTKGIKRVFLFSDGCSAQYKSRLPFMHLTELAHDFAELDIERHFFGSHHGKSLCDSCGGTVKNCVLNAVKNGRTVVQEASHFLDY